jgi:hypothetical protein
MGGERSEWGNRRSSRQEGEEKVADEGERKLFFEHFCGIIQRS